MLVRSPCGIGLTLYGVLDDLRPSVSCQSEKPFEKIHTVCFAVAFVSIHRGFELRFDLTNGHQPHHHSLFRDFFYRLRIKLIFFEEDDFRIRAMGIQKPTIDSGKLSIVGWPWLVDWLADSLASHARFLFTDVYDAHRSFCPH